MSINSSFPSSQYQPSKRRSTLRTREQTQPVEQSPFTLLYNLKDFLPQSSTISLETRNNKPRSTIPPESSLIYKVNSQQANSQSVEQRVMQQKMNKLKQLNSQLQQTSDQQKFTISKQQQQINRLKSQLNSIKLAQQAKAKRLAIWNYKYHAQYTPKQRYKYSLAVQTVDEGVYARANGNGATTGLRAKDFEDIYRRLNSTAPTDGMKKKMVKEQGVASSNIFAGGITGNKSSMGLTHKKQSTLILNPQNKSTLKLTKFFLENRSITGAKLSNQQNPFNEQSSTNKQNMMLMGNFGINPMSLNLQKMTNKQKPIKEQCIEIYPVDEGYLDGIVGEILCGEDD